MIVNELFGFSDKDFEMLYPDESACLEKLAQLKWRDGFVCRKCGHTHYCEGKYPMSRRCTKCKKEETVKSNTIFNSCKLPLKIVFKMMNTVYQKPDISSKELCNMFEIRQMTCWKIKNKIKELGQSNSLTINKSDFEK